jgi:hypothetical protein
MFNRSRILLIVASFAFVESALSQDMGLLKAQAIRDNVVSVRSSYGVGFGFIVGERDGVLYIVTANHVVRGPNDGGPNDKANVDIGFFTERGSTYSAVLQDTWLSSRKEDLAVITITTPPRFKWRYEGFAPQRDSVEGTLVWTVGRDGEWLVAEKPGQIRLKSPNGVLAVEGFNDIAAGGMSGGVIVSKDGVEGLIQSKGGQGELQVMSLPTIRRFMEAWGHPWGIGGIERKFTDHERQVALGKTLIVGDNQTLVIGRRDSDLVVERFSMGRNSVIRFEEGVREWSMTALSASFGSGAAIDGTGSNGSRGVWGDKGQDGYDCKDGGNGRDGSDGGDGTDGVSIRMKLGIQAIDSLVFNLSGGHGGDGGDGGSGGNTGVQQALNCRGGDGGDGGLGGNGGRGGNGGALVLDYFFLDDPKRTLSEKHIRFLIRRGEGGSAGSAGSPGGGYKGGRSGQYGEVGRSGVNGRTGELIVRSM